jgi:biopolymer transport protein ExbD
MKTITTLLVFVCFCSLSTFAQQPLSLSVKEKSDDPISNVERSHLLELKNNSNKTLNITIHTEDTSCAQVQKSSQTSLIKEIQLKNSNSKQNQLSISPNQTIEFYLKTIRPKGTKLNTWNCTKVSVSSNDQKAASNSITISTLIPNPNDAN